MHRNPQKDWKPALRMPIGKARSLADRGFQPIHAKRPKGFVKGGHSNRAIARNLRKTVSFPVAGIADEPWISRLQKYTEKE